MTQDNETFTLKETLSHLGISRTYLYSLIRSGKLTPIEQETILKQPRLKFRKKDVERLLRHPEQETEIEQEQPSNVVAA